MSLRYGVVQAAPFGGIFSHVSILTSVYRDLGGKLVLSFSFVSHYRLRSYCKLSYHSRWKSFFTASANSSSTSTWHPTTAIPAAQAIALSNPSGEPAPLVNSGVWLTPFAGIQKTPWKPGTTYDTLPNALLAAVNQKPRGRGLTNPYQLKPPRVRPFVQSYQAECGDPLPALLRHSFHK